MDIAELRILAENYIRPSNMKPMDICSGKPIMEAFTVSMYGEPEEQQEANMGNDMHDRCKVAVSRWNENDIEWGDVIADACNQAAGDGVDGWSVGCLQIALEHVRDIAAKYGIERGNIYTECPLDLNGISIPRGGTADLIFIIPFKLIIVADYKFGFIDQGDAADHDQQVVYATGAASHFHCDRVIVALIQPRAEREHRLTTTEFDAEALRQSITWIGSVLKRVRAEDPELQAHYDACLYCDALLVCPAAEEYIVNTLQALELIGEPMNADDWGLAIGAAKLAEKKCDLLCSAGKRRLIAGEKVTGFKLGNPKAMNSVDSNAALERLNGAGVDLAELAQEGAIKIVLGKLKKPWYDVIDPIIDHALSEPSLMADKRGAK